MRLFLVISSIFCVSACSHVLNQQALQKHNCQGIENWVLKAEGDEVSAHTIRLLSPPKSSEVIHFYWPMITQEEYQHLAADEYQAIAQPTHYWSPKEVAKRAAACFDASIIETSLSIKSLANIGKSSLLIEGSKDEISMTYIPHLSSKLNRPEPPANQN